MVRCILEYLNGEMYSGIPDVEVYSTICECGDVFQNN